MIAADLQLSGLRPDTPLMTQPGAAVGEAVQLAKDQLAQTRPRLIDALLGWSLLGDPTLVIEP